MHKPRRGALIRHFIDAARIRQVASLHRISAGVMLEVTTSRNSLNLMHLRSLVTFPAFGV
jgi:hypothetical protein